MKNDKEYKQLFILSYYFLLLLFMFSLNWICIWNKDQWNTDSIDN